jgi:hypothetical protein
MGNISFISLYSLISFFTFPFNHLFIYFFFLIFRFFVPLYFFPSFLLNLFSSLLNYYIHTLSTVRLNSFPFAVDFNCHSVLMLILSTSLQQTEPDPTKIIWSAATGLMSSLGLNFIGILICPLLVHFPSLTWPTNHRCSYSDDADYTRWL